MFGSHTPAAAISCLDLDFILLAHGLDFLVLCLQVLKLHRLHIYCQRLLVHFPEVHGFGELVAVQLDQLNFERLVDGHVLCHRRVLPLLEVLRDEASKDRDKGGRCAFLRLHHRPLLHLPDVSGYCLDCWLCFRIQLVVHEDELLILFVLTQGGPAHFEYVLVRLDLEAQCTDCHLLEVLAIVNALAQVSETATHEGLPARLLIVRHHAPAVKHAVHGLCLGCGDRQSMQPAIVVLLFHPAVPGGESFGEFEVSRLCAQPVNNFQSIGSRLHIILPHIEPEFELSTPEIRQPALDRV